MCFPQVPRTILDRPDSWLLDEEMGRQALAGMNPCVIQALKVIPHEEMGSNIKGQDIEGEL